MLKKIDEDGIYWANKNGEIFSRYEKGKRGSLSGAMFPIKKSNSTNGYDLVHLYINKKRKTHQVHRLIASIFLENPYNKGMVNHKDLDKKNNCVDNLEWCTAKENCSHAIKMGVAKKPPTKRKMSDLQVMTIRTFNQAKMDSIFAGMYGADKSSICNIRNNKSYRWIL